MAIRAGELLHVGNQVLVDRAQTAGPGNLTVPTEKIYELGNYESVATVRDIPDLAFGMDSLDVSAEMEAMLLGVGFAGAANGTELDMSKARPLDVASLFKTGRGSGQCQPEPLAARRQDLLRAGLGVSEGRGRHQHRRGRRSR